MGIFLKVINHSINPKNQKTDCTFLPCSETANTPTINQAAASSVKTVQLNLKRCERGEEEMMRVNTEEMKYVCKANIEGGMQMIETAQQTKVYE